MTDVYEPCPYLNEPESTREPILETRSRKRPGKSPVRPDETLSKLELERRNKRRKRNREAAQRVRDRRVTRTTELQVQLDALSHQQWKLEEENMQLRNEISKLGQIPIPTQPEIQSSYQPTSVHRRFSNTHKALQEIPDNENHFIFEREVETNYSDVFDNVVMDEKSARNFAFPAKQRKSSSVAHINEILSILQYS